MIFISPLSNAIQCDDEIKYDVYVKRIDAVPYHSNIRATFIESTSKNPITFDMVLYPTSSIFQYQAERILRLAMYFNKKVTLCYKEQGSGLNNSYLYGVNAKD